MKGFFSIFLALTAIASLKTHAADKNFCSNATLKGTYSYTAQGIKGGVAYLETGFETYDGIGNMINVYSDTASPTVEYSTGKYEIGENCRGIATYNSGTVYDFYAYPKGNAFSYILKDGDGDLRIFGGEEIRRTTKLIPLDDAAIRAMKKPLCTNATLNGTYAYNAQGIKANLPYLETGFKTYDGAGKMTSVHSSTANESWAINNTGTYNIQANCQGTLTYDSGVVFSIYVFPTGEGFNYLLTNSGNEDLALMAGEEKRISILPIK